MKHLAVVACCLLFTAGVRAADLEVSNGWIRLLPAGVPAGGYFEIRNLTKSPVRLVGATSSAFGAAMLHQSAEDSGRSTMLHVREVEVPAGGKLAFKPGGYHLMLMQPTGQLRIGEKVAVTLEFADGRKTTAQFEIRGPSGK